jgi:hypothetical protein
VVELRVAGGRPPGPLADYSYALRAEVAATPEKRKQGLLGRRGLEPGYGMIYVYEEPDRPEFSWAGMKFDVSAAFLRPDGTIAQIHRPAGGGTFQPQEPVKYVLEVRRGWFEDRDIQPGDRLDIPEELAGAPARPGPRAEQPAEEGEGAEAEQAPPTRQQQAQD